MFMTHQINKLSFLPVGAERAEGDDDGDFYLLQSESLSFLFSTRDEGIDVFM